LARPLFRLFYQNLGAGDTEQAEWEEHVRNVGSLSNLTFLSIFPQQHYRPSTMKDRTSTAGVEPVFPGPWDQYNFSPASRTQYPIRIHRTTGSVENEANLLDFKSTIVHALKQSNGVKYSELYSSITVDFGKEVCGPVTLKSGRTSTDQTVALAYAESSQ
jgi:hypothetical protein